ncbi:hypothetical protein LXL04_025419 [Taraxacum kok-saghyz]
MSCHSQPPIPFLSVNEFQDRALQHRRRHHQGLLLNHIVRHLPVFIYIRKIHILMGALLVVVTIDLIGGAADKRCVKVIIYKSCVFLYGDCDRIRSSYYTNKGNQPFSYKNRDLERLVMYGGSVDTVCSFSVVIPYMGMCTWLDEVYKAARNFEKIKEDTVWFTLSFYGYFCIWRFVVSSIVTNIPDPFYSYMMEEIFSLVFCMVIFYVYRPAHCLIEGPKMDENKQPGQVSFSYQELPEDFEW